jgi:hypothetical protein
VVNITAEELERTASGRNLGDLLKSLPCGPQGVPTFTRPPGSPSTAKGSLSCIRPLDLRMVEVMRIHNDTRSAFGSQPLVWDPALAASAQSYAGHLARTGVLAHAPREGRGNSRENLSQGMLNWDSRQMLSNWLREQSRFRPGVYPNVSTTGRWDDVSHFTQMVWPKTVALGCGMADGRGHRWLVCRYSPGGNKDGVLIAPAPPVPGRLPAQALCSGPQGPMMCPEPEQGGAAPAGDEDLPQGGATDGGQAQGGGQAQDGGGTRTRETPPPTRVDDDSGIGGGDARCSVKVIAKVLIPTGRKDRNGNPIYKETHNLDHGFAEVVIPHGFEAKGEFKPHAGGTRPYDGTMRATWGIAGARNPFTGTVTGDEAKLARGKWDDTDGVVKIDPGPNLPVVQNHVINAHWASPTNGVECWMPRPFQFVVTFADEVPYPDPLNLETFVGEANRGGFTGTRPRTPFPTGTRAFHDEEPEPVRRPGYVLVPIGIFWDLPKECCAIKGAKREVIQFARAAIRGGNGRMGKAWGLDVVPDELNKPNDTHDPVYTGHPNEHGKDKPTEHGPGGTKTSTSGDVMQWDAPGMPKDLFDRLHAAQGRSEYRQQFLSLLVCRPPRGQSRVETHLAGSRVCQVAITTVRWDFPGQAGVRPRPPRPGAPPEMPYRQPRITISFDVRDGNCASLEDFLEANNLLDEFADPSSEARKLELMPEGRYDELNRDVNDWESNPFGGVTIPAAPR